MFFQIIFLFVIHFVTSNSNQEDLSISNYFHIGCLTLNPDKQFINDGFQENSLLPYQTFSSPNMKIDLCFRLCRRWTILTNNNHTNCICLYTINELYDINESFGEVLSVTDCEANSLQIYSLTKNPYILPSRIPTDDRSFDGCYGLDGFQRKHVNILLPNMSFTSALDSCQKYCQQMYKANYFSFFLSFGNSCYCLPIQLPPSITITAIRKPLVHCSFLPDVKNAYNNSFNATSVHPNTVVKINVQRYCSSSFTFDRYLYQCWKIIVLKESNTHSKPTANDTCSPISVRTIEQYNHLVSLAPPAPSRTYIWINRSSTNLLYNLFKSEENLSESNDSCLVIDRALSLSANLVPCSNAHPSDYIFCAQKPIKIVDNDQLKIQSIETTPILYNITCPADFILFDNICYYVDLTIANNTERGEEVCFDKYANSTLVKFNSHELGNVKAGRILGRTLNDVLLELFYYELEKKLNNEGKSSKEWPRLLIGDEEDENECLLRYFTRSTGGFNISSSCDQGGYPVCQSELIFKEIDERDISHESNGAPLGKPSSITQENSRNEFLVTLSVIIMSLTVLIAIIVVVYHFRQRRRTHSAHDLSNRSNSQTEHIVSTPVIYTPLETSEPSVPIDPDVIKSFDENSLAIIEVSGDYS